MSVNEIYERAASGVVRVNSTSNSTAASGLGSQQTSALGSGFVIDKTGHIVTNYHVVEGADEVTVSFSNRDTVKAEIVGTDPSTDLAVLRVDTSASALTPLPLGDSDAVEVGDPVVAIGNPFGLDRTVTAGIVSALQRLITAPNRFTIDHVIQTDAPINHGNSGGPLLEQPRPGDRRQHADRDRRHRDRQRRDRLLRSLEHRQGRRRADPSHGPRRSRLPRDQRPGRDARRRRQVQPRRSRRASSSSPSRATRAPTRRASKAARRRSSSPARPTSSAATSSSPSTARRFPRSNSSATRSPRTSPATRSRS